MPMIEEHGELADQTNVLEVENLSVAYHVGETKVTAVDSVTFSLARGETLGLAGESGCGKTTLALALLGLHGGDATVTGRAEVGRWQLVGAQEQTLRRVRWREVALVFQGSMSALNPLRRIGDQIAEPLIERLRMSRNSASSRVAELLEKVGLSPDRATDFPHQLSGGMRQRVMIAMGLAGNPQVLIGDEPTTALDVVVQAQILDLMGELRDDFGVSLIIISHDLAALSEICSRIAIMYAGRIVEIGPADEVFARPAHPYTKLLLGAFPDIHLGKRSYSRIEGAPPSPGAVVAGCRFADRCPAVLDLCRTNSPPTVRVGSVDVECHRAGEENLV